MVILRYPMRTRFADFDRLASDGGIPVRTDPLPRWPVFDDEMVNAVRAVLESGRVNYWTGEFCRTFEEDFARYTGCRHAVAVMNGTVALELALEAAGIGPGDEVIVPPRTFIATVSAVVMRGATPVFADLDPISGNLTADTVAAQLTPRTRAIIAVHAAGWPCDMDPIMGLAKTHGLTVIEDCAQAHGATYKGRPVGSLGDIAAFSFCQDKILTTGGEGGMVTTDSTELWKKAWSFKDHGKDWDAVYTRQHDTVFKWLHESFGTNWRMTEMQGAIGCLAVERLDDWVRTRRHNAAILDAQFAEIDGIQVLSPGPEFGHSYYKYYVNVMSDRLHGDWSRDEIVQCLQAEGIPCGSGLCSEVYHELAIQQAGLAPADRLPVAATHADRAIMFAVHPTLSESDMDDMAAAVAKVMRAVESSFDSKRRAA